MPFQTFQLDDEWSCFRKFEGKEQRRKGKVGGDKRERERVGTKNLQRFFRVVATYRVRGGVFADAVRLRHCRPLLIQSLERGRDSAMCFFFFIFFVRKSELCFIISLDRFLLTRPHVYSFAVSATSHGWWEKPIDGRCSASVEKNLFNDVCGVHQINGKRVESGSSVERMTAQRKGSPKMCITRCCKVHITMIQIFYY